MSQARDYFDVRANAVDNRMTHAEAQLHIHNARHAAIQALIDNLDSQVAAMDAQYQAKKEHTDSQIIAYYAARNQVLVFRQELVSHQHSEYVKYQQQKAGIKEIAR